MDSSFADLPGPGTEELIGLKAFSSAISGAAGGNQSQNLRFFIIF